MKTKSANLLARGYELIDGITVPVGTSNVDLGVEGKEPQNAEKLTIAVGNEKINMYVFRPSNYKEGEKTPFVYFIHGGGYHFGNVSMDESKYRAWQTGAVPRLLLLTIHFPWIHHTNIPWSLNKYMQDFFMLMSMRMN